MDKFIFTALILLVACASSTRAAASENNLGSYIVKSGKAVCTIVMPDDATPSEKRAARELQDYIAQITGAQLPQFPESVYSVETGPFVSIGRTKLSSKYVTDDQLKALGEDGYRIFRKDGNTFFVGGRKRGSLYAVYEFLESLGVRWYTPDETIVPKSTDIKAPAKAIQYVPIIWYRDQYWNNGFTPEWRARMRINGNNGEVKKLPDDLGGSYAVMYGCHSYMVLVPPSENFAKHPEWFALTEDGNRSEGELCLTNTELREFVINKVLVDLKASPIPIGGYWVSQNDGSMSACFCEKCTAERVAHGGKDRWSANTISFTSYVADRVAKDFPGVHIKTLAYTYTRTAPDNMKASDHLLVEICGNFGPGDDPHSKLVKSWSKVAKNIEVYTYGGSNFGYWWPYPNVWEVGMQIPWARDNGVRAFYIQGTALGKGSGLVDMKAYLSARLAWDPSRNVKKEMKDFCKGFYGPAGKYVIEYLDWYSNYIKQHKMVMDGGWGDADKWKEWVTLDAMEHCDAIFQSALVAAKDDPVYLKHVRRAYLEVLWGRIAVDLEPKSYLSDKNLNIRPGADAAAVTARAKLFGEIMRENGYNRWSEVVVFDPATYPH